MCVEPPVEQARLDEQFLAEMSSVERLKTMYPAPEESE